MNMLVVFVTCADKTEAKRISEALVADRLVACVNILAPVESHYVWEGKAGWSSEIPLLMKTLPEKFDSVSQRIRSLHSYTTPNITAWEARADTKFAEWVKESVAE
jgi:periplasmic divalent cation tolerance protein